MKHESYHITLAFLGDVDEAEKRLAMDAMDAACTGIGPIPLASDGLGKFGRASDATLWMGVKPHDALGHLARCMREELDARSLDYDRKPFRAHITLARRARIPKTDLPPLAFPLDDVATAVTLFKSELSHEGARYKRLYTVELA